MNKQDYDTIKQALEELSHIESNSGCNDNDKSPTALDTLERVFSEQDSIISKLSQKIDNQNERIYNLNNFIEGNKTIENIFRDKCIELATKINELETWISLGEK